MSFNWTKPAQQAVPQPQYAPTQQQQYAPQQPQYAPQQPQYAPPPQQAQPVQQPSAPLNFAGFGRPQQQSPQNQVPAQQAFGGEAALFQSIGAAKARREGNYIKPCHCLFKVMKCGFGQSATNGAFFVAEMMCLWDLAPDAYKDGPPETGYGHRTGDEVSIMHMAKFKSFDGNVKAFLTNALGMEDTQVDANVVSQVCGPANPLHGLVIEVQARTIITKGNQKPLTATSVKGSVPWATVASFLASQPNGQAAIDKVFPNGQLQQLIALEQSSAQRQ